MLGKYGVYLGVWGLLAVGILGNFTTLHWITFHSTALQCIQLHYNALYCTALQCLQLHYISLHISALNCIQFQNTALKGKQGKFKSSWHTSFICITDFHRIFEVCFVVYAECLAYKHVVWRGLKSRTIILVQQSQMVERFCNMKAQPLCEEKNFSSGMRVLGAFIHKLYL